MLLINTFDVEPWWATVPPSVDVALWNELPDRSADGLYKHLDLCDEANVKCTYFFVGWYAQRFPQRVAEVVRRGHSLGCHSLWHEDVALLSTKNFRSSTQQAKAMVEDAGASPAIAYRAPSFSFPTDRCLEYFQVLKELGFKIDSSISTAARAYGGGFSSIDFPEPRSVLKTHGVDMFEIPVPGIKFLGKELQVFGGGYLRVLPEQLINVAMKGAGYQVIYLHPHDFDLALPSLPNASFVSNVRRRLRIGSLESKIIKLYKSCQVLCCEGILGSYGVQN